MKSLEVFLSDLRQREVQLWLDGDRLRYRAPEGCLSAENLAELRDRKAEVIAFLQAAQQMTRPPTLPLQPVPRTGELPLSFAQQRFWFLYQFEPDSPANNVPVVMRFTGNLDLAVLNRSLAAVIRRHEVLRSRFPMVAGQPVLVIAPTLDLALPIVDLRQIPDAQREAETQRLATKDAQQPFNLETDPMLRVTLFRLRDDEALLLWTMPCMVCDGTSSDLFYRELTACYVADATHQDPQLPDLPIQYPDFAHWQRQVLQGEVLASHLSYWKQQLGDALTSLQLPTDYLRPAGTPTCRGDRYARMLPRSLHQALLTLSQQLGVTLFGVLLTAFDILLYRYSQNDDILTTFVSSGRSQIETENLIGFFSNTLMLRTQFDPDLTLRELVQRIHRQNLAAYAHQELPFERLVDALGPEQRQGRSPLFQTKFTLNPPWTNGQGMAPITLPDLKIESLFGYIYHGQTKYDLILVTREQEQGLGAVIDYNAELFAAPTIERMMGHFQTLLEAMVANPDQRLSRVALLTAPEQHQLLQTWNPTQTPERQHSTIHRALEAQSAATPAAIALICGAQTLTYGDLNQQANQLAHYLQTQGWISATPIAVCLSRSIQAVVTLLAILKAGGSYLPLDPLAAQAQLDQILQAVPVERAIVEPITIEKLGNFGGKLLNWDTLAAAIQTAPTDHLLDRTPDRTPDRTSAQSLACVLYSTAAGSLQSFAISHQQVMQQAQAGPSHGWTAESVGLHHTSLTSEMALWELWGSLLNGAQLAIAPGLASAIDEFGTLISQHQVTTLWLPVRVFHRLMQTSLEPLSSLRQLLTGGDGLAVPPVQTLLHQLPACQLMHLCAHPIAAGPICAHPIAAIANLSTAIPVGRPVAPTQVYILDPYCQLLPIGVAGTLYVGGASLAQPYGQPADLPPDDRWICHPFSPDPQARLYRTDIVARYLPDGAIEQISPPDRAITRPGWRIELGRIETYLSQHPAVQEAVVVADPSLPDCLIAYVVCQPHAHASASDLRNDLKPKLPTLSLPSTFVFLAALPLTPAGTVDYSRLAQAPPVVQIQPAPVAEVQDQVTQKLTKIWQQLFNLPAIGVDDNFFDLGGDSLLAVRLFSQIEADCGVRLPLSTLLQSATIAHLAPLLRQGAIEADWSPLVLIQAGSAAKPPLFCIHGGGFNVLVYRDLAMHLDSSQTVYGLQARGLAGDQSLIRDCLEDMAADYIDQIRSVQPTGPYYLSGLSSGGNLALEMAQQLTAQGEAVAFLGMFDSYGPGGIHRLAPAPRFLSSVRYLWRHSIPRYVGKKLNLTQTQVPPKTCKIPTIFPAQPGDFQPKSVVEPKSSDRSSPAPRPHPVSATFLDPWFELVSQYVLEHSPWAFFTPKAGLAAAADSTSAALDQLEKRYQKSYKAYVPKSYSGKIILFRAKELPPGYALEPALGWQTIALGGVEVYTIPGHHTSLMAAPALAETVKIYLDQAPTSGVSRSA